jgi:hypothetical protein
MFPNNCSQLAEIIKKFEGADRILSNEVPQNYINPLLIVDELSIADIETCEKIIYRLHEDLNRAKLRFEGNQSYISIALSYAYCIKNNTIEGQNYAEDARRQFANSGTIWNQAISQWFLGIVYSNNNLIAKSKDELEGALEILKRIIRWGKLDPETLKYCKYQIGQIAKDLNKLSVGSSPMPASSEPSIYYQDFTQIIGLLEVPQDKSYQEWLDAIYSLETSDVLHINEQIDILINTLNQRKDQDPIAVPFINIFLAHCYNSGYFAGDTASISYSISYAENARADYDSLNDNYNLAICTWYLSLLYRCIPDIKKSVSLLYESKHILEGLLEAYKDSDISDDVQSLLRDIQLWIDPTSVQKVKAPQWPQRQPVQKAKIEKKSSRSWLGINKETKPKSPQSTPFRKNEYSISLPKLVSQESNEIDQKKVNIPQETSFVIPESNQKPLQHIIIPVDIQVLRDLNVNSSFLEPQFFETLQNYGKKFESNVFQQPQKVKPKTISPGANRVKTIPRFSIYGQTGAGKGEPNWDVWEDIAQEVYDDLCIEFYGEEYSVKFIERKQYNFLDVERYGWLKVIGESMNDCQEIPIKNGSYILFKENRDINFCATKVVVAVIPELDTQPAQLIVKRLLKFTSPLPSRNDGFAPESSMFVLRSESIYKLDPSTGERYNDIEVSRDNQIKIIGQVIAVASLTE